MVDAIVLQQKKDVDDLAVSQCGLVAIDCRTGVQEFSYFQWCVLDS